MQELAKVTAPLPEKRGPDVRCTVTVAPHWLASGATLAFAVPRLASCAACEGGGCGVCRSQGALTLRERGADPEPLLVHLGKTGQTTAQLIRIPGQGAEAWEPGEPRGCLLLQVEPGQTTSAEVSLVSTTELDGATLSSSQILVGVAVLALLVLVLVVVTGGK